MSRVEIPTADWVRAEVETKAAEKAAEAVDARLVEIQPVGDVGEAQIVQGEQGRSAYQVYSTDGTSWTDLCTLAVGAGTGAKAGTFTAIPNPARIATCHIRLRGTQGDGTADPAFHHVTLETR